MGIIIGILAFIIGYAVGLFRAGRIIGKQFVMKKGRFYKLFKESKENDRD